MPDSNVFTDVKISELPVANQVNDSDQLEANQGGTTRRITVGQIVTAAAAHAVAPVVVTGGTSTAVLSTDDEIIIRKSPGAPHEVILEASPVPGAKHRITDGNGQASTYNITIKDGGGTTLYTMAAHHETVTLRWDGSAWGFLP